MRTKDEWPYPKKNCANLLRFHEAENLKTLFRLELHIRLVGLEKRDKRFAVAVGFGKNLFINLSMQTY